MKIQLMGTSLVLAMVLSARAQDKPAVPARAGSDAARHDVPAVPNDLPGHGLGEHDFLYAGEAKDRKVFIIVKSKVVWSYDDPAGKGEISDATRLSNGNLLIAHQFAMKLIAPDKRVIWNYDAPKGTEIHTAVPIGKEHVLFIQNGDPALLRVINITTNKIEKEFPLPVKNPKSVHGQFRHARLTAEGTVVVAHMDLGKVVEYDSSGKELWSIAAPGAWGVTPLKNGNLLIVDRADVREVNRNHDTVWSCGKSDIPGYKLTNLQLAWRLPNGNTLINNWVNQWSGPIDPATAPVQAIELSPDKKVVWALRSWSDPNLGPATTIQILDDDTQAPENVTFGDFQ